MKRKVEIAIREIKANRDAAIAAGKPFDMKAAIRIQARRLRIPAEKWEEFFRCVGKEFNAHADVAQSTAA